MTLIASNLVSIGAVTNVNEINDEDEVVGSANGGTSAFTWQNGQVNTLPLVAGDQDGSALGINNQGQIVGYSYTGNVYHAISWLNGQEMQLSGLGSSTRDYAINDQGIIVGSSEDSKGLAVATAIVNGTLYQLGQLPGGYQSISGLAVSRAFGVNDLGQVVGISLNSMGVQQAVLWQNGTVTELGSFSEGIESFAYRINNHGVAVGFAEDSNGIDQAVVWQNGTMTVLPDHQSNGHSIAFGINDAGVIVGRSDIYTISSGWQDDAVVWQNGVLTDLNTFLPGNSGWVLNVAQSINDNGEIAGIGTYNGVTTGFVMSVGDSSGPMMTAASALQAFQTTLHGAALSVSDTAAIVSADLDALQGLASVGKLLQLQLSDSGALTLTASQATADASALADLSGSYSLHLTQETISNATTLLAQPHVTGVGITDSSYFIANSLDQLETWVAAGQVTAISLTDFADPTLSVTAQQVVNDAAALKAIQGIYTLQVSGETVAQALTFSGEYSVAPGQIIDSINNAANAAVQLQALPENYSLSLTGTVADLQAHWDTLANLDWTRAEDMSEAVTDSTFSTLSLTASQFSSGAGLIAGLHGNVIVAIDVSQAPNALISNDEGPALVAVFPNPVSEYALSTWSGNTLEVQDTGTGRNSADYLTQLTALQFADGTDFIVQAPSTTGVTSGNVAELYSAVFARAPDLGGLIYYEQLVQYNNGPSMLQLAGYFLQSPEYTGSSAHNYAQSAAGDAQFVTDTYQNLLHRAPESGSVTFYQNVVAQFTAGLTPGSTAYTAAQMQGHAQVLVYFSASAEFLSDVQITAQHPADAQHWLYVI